MRVTWQGFAESPVDEWQSRIRMEQSVDALSSKDVQFGLENGQKPTSGKSDSGHSSLGC